MNIHAQIIDIDTIISENELATLNNQKLFILDFWATWCVPCKHATKQLEFIQEDYKDEVFMISISDESNQKIRDFLSKNPIKLMVVSDDNGKNFYKYKIKNRPYAVILNGDGEIKWEGKASDINRVMLLNLILKQKGKAKTKHFEDLFKILDKKTINMSYSEEIDTMLPFSIQVSSATVKLNSKYKFIGSLREFYSIYNSIPINLIEKNSFTSQWYEIQFSAEQVNLLSKRQLINFILDTLEFQVTEKSKKIKGKEFTIKDPTMLWDSTQIKSEPGMETNTISEFRLEADNKTISEIVSQLSDLKNETYIYEGDNALVYDWSFNYSIDKLMKEELLTSFGIQINEIDKPIIHYIISK